MRTAALLATALWAGLPAPFHPPFSGEFDSSKPVTVEGAVTRADWENPHGFFPLDVTRAGGGFLARNGARTAEGRPDALAGGRRIVSDRNC